MRPTKFDDWVVQLDRDGAQAALDSLARSLAEKGDIHRYFDALALAARNRIGLPAVLPADDELPRDDKRVLYEAALTEACREVGARAIQSGDWAAAFRYLNAIGEMESLRAAIDAYDSAEDDKNGAQDRIDLVVELAIGQSIHPRKGLEIIVQRAGLCPAITTAQGIMMQDPRPAVREECARLLVGKLHSELSERVRGHIEQVEGRVPDVTVDFTSLLVSRDWLFDDDNYHVDTSHLNSVVRFARHLTDFEAIAQAVDLCEYGCRLSERYRYSEPSPFEDVYADTRIYLRCVGGSDIDAGLAHFRAKAEVANVSEGELYPAEIYVRLLLLHDRADDAIAFAGASINGIGSGPGCPSVDEICRRYGRFDEMARWAEARGDEVAFAAAVLQARSS